MEKQLWAKLSGMIYVLSNLQQMSGYPWRMLDCIFCRWLGFTKSQNPLVFHSVRNANQKGTVIAFPGVDGAVAKARLVREALYP